MIQWKRRRRPDIIRTAAGLTRHWSMEVRMATLTALTFHSLRGAADALATVEQLQQQGLMQILDAATIRWPRRARKPDAHEQAMEAGRASLDGSFWRLLFGIIFLAPRFEATAAASGAVVGSLADIGIDEVFIMDVRAHVIPNTSALFILSDGAVTDRVIEELDPLNPSVIATNLTRAKQARLFDIFSAGPASQRTTVE